MKNYFSERCNNENFVKKTNAVLENDQAFFGW